VRPVDRGLLRDRRKWALEMERLSLCQRCQWILEGGLLSWGPWRIIKWMLWKRECFTVRAPLADQGGALISRGIWKKGVIFIYQEILFVAESEKCAKKGSGNGQFHNGPNREPEGEFVYQGLWKTVKDCSVNGASLSMVALRGVLGGVASLLRTVKTMSYRYSATGSKTGFGP